MSLEDAIKRYSKKWGVSEEEAKKKIKQLLESGEKKVPSIENIFPEPVGEISKKIQDINQALMSTAYTRRILNNPPEDIAVLHQRIERLDSVVAGLKEGLEEKINKITETLEDKKRKEVREELLQELEARMKPVEEGIRRLSEKLEGGGVSGEEKPEDILTKAEHVAAKAKKWLERQGYKIEPERLSKEEVQRMIEEAQKKALETVSPDELKGRLERAGYKIVGGPITWDQVEKLLEKERMKAQEEILEDKRIDAVKDVIVEGISKIVEMFKPAVELALTPPEVAGRSSVLPASQESAGSSE